MNNKLIGMITLIAGASVAMAGSIYDEAIDGDLSGDPTAPTALSFSAGDNLVIGTTLGSSSPPSTGYDVWSFTVGAGETLSNVWLNAYLPTTGGTSGMALTTGAAAGNFGTVIFWETPGGADAGTDLLLAGGGPVGPGTYYFEIREFGGPLAEWELNFAVTPAPASAALLGLGGLVATRRRR